jgi:hypothetical protein
MTESDWLAATEPTPLLEFLRHSGMLTERKAQLFAAACCRGIWHLLADPRSRRAVEVAEQFAEGRVGNEEVMAAWGPAWEAANEALEAKPIVEQASATNPWDTAPAAQAAGNALAGHPAAAADAALAAVLYSAEGADERAADQERLRQAALLHDLFGPLPFRTVYIEPAWLTAAVMALANSMDTEGRFEDMPILADALDEAGCTNQEILQHLRRPGHVHVRGCFIVDLLLEKQ